MSVLEDLKVDFEFAIRSRGKEYYLDDAVQIQNSEPGMIKAIVTGGSKYRAELRWEPMGVAYSCTCPHFQDHDKPCKHLWATLLEADHQGILETAARRIEPNGRGPSPRPVGEQHANGAIVPTRRKPMWKTQLEKMRDSMGRVSRLQVNTNVDTAWPDDRRLMYAIDVERSAQSLGGGLVLRLFTQRFTKASKWGEPRRFGFSVDQWLNTTDPIDRQIAQVLVGSKRGFYISANDPTIELAGWAHGEVLRQIVQTGRCYLSRGDNPFGEPITWDAGDAYEFRVELRPDDRATGHRLLATLARGDESIALTSASVCVSHGWVVFSDRVAKLEHGNAYQFMMEMRRADEMVIPAADTEQLIADLFAMPTLPAVKLPESAGVRTIACVPVPHLQIFAPTKNGILAPGTLQVEPSYAYESTVVMASDERQTIYDPTTRTLVRRHRAEEEKRNQELHAIGIRVDSMASRETPVRVLPTERLADAVAGLIAAGWRVEADGKMYRSAGNVDVAVRSGINWFDLDVNIDFGDAKANLPALLSALRRGQKMVQLDDGTLGVLPEEWLQRYATLASVGEEQDDGTLRFASNQAGFLDALIAAMPQARTDETFEKARQQLQSFAGITGVEPPATFVGSLREYQREGLGWLRFLQDFRFGGCLADDMGLGKTVQVLAMLDARRESGAGTSLVVVPKSLVFNWIAEAAKFAPKLKVLEYSGVDRDKNIDSFRNYNFVLTTYGTLRRDIAALKDFQFDHVILDESQAIKNASTASAKSVRLLRAQHRLAMSGTPIENHLGELWSLFDFLNPGMLGNASVFKLLSGGPTTSPEGRQLIARAVRPFILRRTKKQVAKELPDRVEQTIYCELDEGQRKLYDELRDHYRVALLQRIDEVGLGQSKIQVLEALLRLRQAACHPGLFDQKHVGGSSAKLETLLDQLADLHEEGHKALVFSQFTSFLALLRKQLDARGLTYEYLDGQTANRQQHVERFQTDPDCKLFLISLKAGGVGLNLTAAEYVFLLDPWWNPAVEAQAIDRAHRIGQTRTVFAYRLIAKDTVEEKVLQLQSSKRELADAIINEDNSLIGGLTTDDLKLLLS
jgi:superfamily II DNA or RNA helicase